MNKKLLPLLILVLSFSINTSYAEEEVSKEQRPMLYKTLPIESKRELRGEDREKGETPNLMKVYKSENKKDSDSGSETDSRPDKGRGAGLPSCSETKDMMEKRLYVLNSNLTKRVSVNEKVRTVVSSKISQLKSAGIDTSKVEESFSSYETSLQTLITDREKLISTLSELTMFDCINSPAPFKDNLKKFNQDFRNQNLEFNKLNKTLRVGVFYELNKLIELLPSKTSEESTNE
jgi:hypothetical protein